MPAYHCVIALVLTRFFVLEAEEYAQWHNGEAEDDDPGVDDTEDFDQAAVLVVVEAEGLEGRLEAVADVDADDGEEDEVAQHDVPDAEFLSSHVVEVGLELGFGEGLLQHVALSGADLAYPLHVFAGFALVDEAHEGHLSLFADFLVGAVDDEVLGLDHIGAFYEVEFHEVEVVEVEDDAHEQQAAGDHHEFASFAGLGLAGFFVAHRTVAAVLEPQIGGEAEVQDEASEEDYLEDLDEDVGAHEVAEGAVGVAAVFGQDKQVGCHVEQQENQ